MLFEVYIWTCRFWQPNWYAIRGLYLNLQIFCNRTDMLFEVYIWTCKFWQPNWYAIRGLYLNLQILATELICYSRSIFEPADFGNRTDILFEVYIWTCRFWQPNWYAIRGLYLNLQILATELIYYSRSIFEPADFGNRTDILFEVYIWFCRFWQPNWYAIRKNVRPRRINFFVNFN